MTLNELLTNKIDEMSYIESKFRNKNLTKFYKEKLFFLIFQTKYLNDYINKKETKE